MWKGFFFSAENEIFHQGNLKCICGLPFESKAGPGTISLYPKEFLSLQMEGSLWAVLSVKGFFCWSCCLTNELVAWKKKNMAVTLLFPSNKWQLNKKWAQQKAMVLTLLLAFKALQCEKEIYRCSSMTNSKKRKELLMFNAQQKSTKVKKGNWIIQRIG